MRAFSVVFLPLLFCIGAELRAQQATPPATPPPLIQVFRDRSPVPVNGNEVSVPHDAVQVRFVVTRRPGQVRYQLEGIDKEWIQRLGSMYFGIRFFDSSGDLISQQAFLAAGRSPGWSESLEQSAFTAREENVAVPPGSDHAALFMSSAGPSACVGIFGVEDVTLSTRSGTVAYPPSASAPTGSPLRWIKGGTRPSMASVAIVRDSQVLAIEDNDIRAHADWYTPNEGGTRVAPGEIVTLRWKEAYSNGMGDLLSLSYGRLPPGSYRFRVEEVGISGVPLRTEHSMVVRVPLPLWWNPWFWLACFGTACVAGIAISHQVVQARIRRHLTQARLIEEERARIARDLHDDLGAGLSQIALASSHACTKTTEGPARESFTAITDMSRELMLSLSETIWMLNPRNDNLESLTDFLCRQTGTLCRQAGISCRLDIRPMQEPQDLSGKPQGDKESLENSVVRNDVRHNICLAVREATTNALRHSGATEIRLIIRFGIPEISIIVEDNGKGMLTDAEEAPGSTGGNGMANMERRMAAIRGHFSVESGPGDKGARIRFTVPLIPQPSTSASITGSHP